MSIDVERLKVDRGYWDEVAPNGATHYGPDDGFHMEAWFKNVVDDTADCMIVCDYPEWISGKVMEGILIPRPALKQWSGPEDGLPPVGAECEITVTSAPVKIVAHVREGEDDLAVYQCLKEDDWGAHSANKFRPLKTEKERVVEAALALDEYPRGQSAGGMMSRKDFCAKLYDAGALKMPGGKV